MPALKSMHALIDSTAFGVNVIIIHALGLRTYMDVKCGCVSVGVKCVVVMCVCSHLVCVVYCTRVLCNKCTHFQVVMDTIMQHCTPWHLSMGLATLQNHIMYVYAVYMYT